MLHTSAPGCWPPRIPPLCKSKPFPPHKAATQITLDAKQIVVTSGPVPGRCRSPCGAGEERGPGQRLRLQLPSPNPARRCLAGGASHGQSYALALGQ